MIHSFVAIQTKASLFFFLVVVQHSSLHSKAYSFVLTAVTSILVLVHGGTVDASGTEINYICLKMTDNLC
jgi:hypothetical protein